MKRKTLVLLLGLVLAFALTACGGDTTAEDTGSEQETTQAEQADADAGQQVGQGQHTAGGLKQGLGQLQSGA